MSMEKKEEIVSVIKKCAEKLGRPPSIAEFRKASRISWYQVYKHFQGIRAAVRAAGLEPGPKGGPLNENALVLDWARVVRELSRLPSRAEYSARGKHHSVTLHARIGWSQMAHRFVLLAREFHIEREWGDVLETVWKKYPLLKTVGRLPGLENQNLEPQRTRRNTEGAEDRVIGNGGTAEGRRESTGRDANRGMRLGKVVAAALAVEILMAAAVGSAQQSAIGTQAGNWQIANGNWPERQDQE